MKPGISKGSLRHFGFGLKAHQGGSQQQLTLYRSCLDFRGPDHPRSLCATADLGLLLLARERPKVREVNGMTWIGWHRWYRWYRCIDSSVQGKYKFEVSIKKASKPHQTLHMKMRQEGEQLLRCALEGFQKQLGESHPQAGMRSCQLGNLVCSDPKRWASLVITKQGLPCRRPEDCQSCSRG